MNTTLLQQLCEQAMTGSNDTDRHALALFAIALGSRSKTFVELGIRQGNTTRPLLAAAEMLGGQLWSVDIEKPKNFSSESKNWNFCQQDSIEFLEQWDPSVKIDFIYIDDWHVYKHVKKELEIIDRLVGPSSVVLIHDLMYGGTEPFYHSDLTLTQGDFAGGGPYRAVAELNPRFWEWSTLPWHSGLTLLRKKYSSKYHSK
jgi:hypothetical protein